MADIEHDPGNAISLLQLAQELVGESSLENFGAKLPFGRDFFERALDPESLLNISERNTEAALALIHLVRQLGVLRLSERFSKEFFGRPYTPGYLFELIKYNPEAALAWFQLMRELDETRFFERFGKESPYSVEFIEWALDLDYLLELSERGHPEEALSLLQLARATGDVEFFKRLVKESQHIEEDFFRLTSDPRGLLELGEHNPEAALVWVQLVR